MFNKTGFKIALVKHGLPACGLAQKLRIDRATFSRITNSWIDPKTKVKQRIAKALGLGISDLWLEEEAKGKKGAVKT